MIDEVTICLHSAQPDVVEKQLELLSGINDKYKVHYNKRIDRHPGPYDSFSALVNDHVATSPSEHIIFISDDTVPSGDDIQFLLDKLDNGFAVASLISIAFMAFTKEVFRVVGWWDERYLGGGYEDDEFVLKMRCHEMAYYESHTGTNDRSVRGGNNKPSFLQYPLQYSGPHFANKWSTECDMIKQRVTDEVYAKYEGKLGPRRYDISGKWKTWDNTECWIGFDQERINAGLIGPSRTYWFRQRDGFEHNTVFSPFITPKGWQNEK